MIRVNAQTGFRTTLTTVVLSADIDPDPELSWDSPRGSACPNR